MKWWTADNGDWNIFRPRERVTAKSHELLNYLQCGWWGCGLSIAGSPRFCIAKPITAHHHQLLGSGWSRRCLYMSISLTSTGTPSQTTQASMHAERLFLLVLLEALIFADYSFSSPRITSERRPKLSGRAASAPGSLAKQASCLPPRQ